jgi:hypothetical protein
MRYQGPARSDPVVRASLSGYGQGFPGVTRRWRRIPRASCGSAAQPYPPSSLARPLVSCWQALLSKAVDSLLGGSSPRAYPRRLRENTKLPGPFYSVRSNPGRVVPPESGAAPPTPACPLLIATVQTRNSAKPEGNMDVTKDQFTELLLQMHTKRRGEWKWHPKELGIPA